MWLAERHWILDLSSVRFLIVGAVNTCSGLLIIYACKYYFEYSDVLANLIGYSLGAILSFSLNSRWTFSYEGGQVVAFFKYLLAILVGYFVNLFVVLYAIDDWGINSYIAQAMGVVPYALITYFSAKHFIFKKAIGE